MSKRDFVLKLMADRDRVESEINESRDASKSHGVTIDEPLVTSDGFPRHDVDVHAIRNIRVQLIRKQNDSRALLEEIRNNLQYAFPDKQKTAKTTKPADTSTESKPAQPKPFAVIKNVVSGSLGAEAGLEADDYISKFGDVTDVSKLPEEMKKAMNNTLQICVLRDGERKEINVNIVPGRSLGTHIVPA